MVRPTAGILICFIFVFLIPLPDSFKQTYPGSHRNIEALRRTSHRNRDQKVAMLRGQPSQTLAFGTHHNCQRSAQVSPVQAFSCFSGGTIYPNTTFLQLPDCARKVSHLHERDMFGGPTGNETYSICDSNRSILGGNNGMNSGGIG